MDVRFWLDVAGMLSQVLLLLTMLRARVRAAAFIGTGRTLAALAALVYSFALDALTNLVALALILRLFVRPSVFAVAPALLGLVALFPYPFARHILVGWGLPRSAYWLSLLSHRTFWSDRRGGAVAVGAWALLCRCAAPARVPAEQTRRLELLGFLERRLALSGALMPPSVPTRFDRFLFFLPAAPTPSSMWLAAGLLAAVRADLDGARALLARVGPDAPLEIQRRALEWRCADAVERGDWRWLATVRHKRSPLIEFLSEVARRFVGQPPFDQFPGMPSCGTPTLDHLDALWRSAPHAKRTRFLVDRALQGDGRLRSPVAICVTSRHDSDEPLRNAMTLHAHLLSCEPTKARAAVLLNALGEAWERALHDELTQLRIRARAKELGVADDVNPLADLTEQVRGQLRGLIERHGVPLDRLRDSGALLWDAARGHRLAVVSEVEEAVGRLTARVDTDRRLPSGDEAHEFEQIRSLYMRAAAYGGVDTRRMMFASLHTALCGFGVWLHNQRHQRQVSNMVFRWLLSEAILCEDDAGMRLEARNTRAGGMQ